METLLSEPFFTRRMKMLSSRDGFMLYGKLRVDFFSTSELLYPNIKIRVRIIRARPNFYLISDNPKVSLGIADCSLYNRRIALKDDYHKKRIDSWRVQLFGNSCKDFYHSCQTKPVQSGKQVQHCSISSDCFCSDYKLCIHWILY